MKLKLNLNIALLSIITAVLLYFVASAANHGIDLTDEGLYLLSTTADYKSVITVSYSHLFIGWLADMFNLQIVGLRILRLVLLVTSALVLAYGVKRYFQQAIKGISLIELSLLAIIASCLGYAFGPQTLSYNSFLAVCVNFAAGFMLLALAENLKKSQRITTLVLTGMFLVPIILTKITSGLLFSLLLVAIIIIIKKREFWRDLLLVFAGTVTAIALYSLLIDSFFTTMQNLWVAGNFLAGEESHSAGNLIEEAKKFFKMVGWQALLALAVFGIVKFIDLMNSEKKKIGAKDFMQALVFVITGGLLVKKYLAAELTPVITEIVIFTLLSLVFISVKNTVFKKPNIDKTLFVYLLLALLPLVCAFGTNNSLSINTLFNMPFWLVIIYLLLVKIDSQVLKFGVLTLLSVFIVHNTQLKLWQNPYRQLPLSEHNKSLNLPISPYLMVDSPTAEFVAQLNTVLVKNGYRKGDDIVAMFKMPGLVYLLEGKAPGGVLWNEAVSNLFFFNLEQQKIESEPYFIINSNCSPEFAEKLNTFFAFPAKYTMCAQLSYKDGGCLVFAPTSKAVKQ